MSLMFKSIILATNNIYKSERRETPNQENYPTTPIKQHLRYNTYKDDDRSALLDVRWKQVL
jgi:hypothetical protein